MGKITFEAERRGKIDQSFAQTVGKAVEILWNVLKVKESGEMINKYGTGQAS